MLTYSADELAAAHGSQNAKPMISALRHGLRRGAALAGGERITLK